ncbi:MAG: 2-phospho-L-lactate transferase [Chloroflexi bacterium]|nr:2-phospho-L-lactate transferase [Chloroflexota bacterium]
MNGHKQVVALAGGVGGAKLVYGLSKVLSPGDLTIIGNVGDDFVHYGLHISPDLDTVLYTLAEVANPITGWGLADDTRHMLDMLRRYGEDTWFGLGDHDLATHLLRTHWLGQGHTLTEITARLVLALGVAHPLLPVTDDLLATMVDTVEYGTLPFQEYFVRYRWQPAVERVWFQGADRARMTVEVASALANADMIIFCPSNPVLSIAPILAVPGIREALETRRASSIVVSPFVGGKAVKGPAAKLMNELGLEVSPRGVAQYYAGLVDGLVVDVSDRDLPLPDRVEILTTRTLMQSGADKVRLAKQILDWVGSRTA